MELDLLEKNQIFGKNRLNIFDKYDITSEVTDFAITLGANVKQNILTNYNLKNIKGKWWTKTNHIFLDDYVYIINDNNMFNDKVENAYVFHRTAGIRPIIQYSKIPIISNESDKIFYGEYPQYVVDYDKTLELEELYQNNMLNKTGKVYTTDSVEWGALYMNFTKREHIEYEYQGKKYIRTICDKNNGGVILSNGKMIKEWSKIWIEVKPIEWIVDKEADIAISKNVIAAGIQFNRGKTEDFKDTFIYKFMNTYLVKDMFDNVSINKEKDASKEFVSIDNKIKILRKRIDNIRK